MLIVSHSRYDFDSLLESSKDSEQEQNERARLDTSKWKYCIGYKIFSSSSTGV
jgi:hypothetical protein